MGDRKKLRFLGHGQNPVWVTKDEYLGEAGAGDRFQLPTGSLRGLSVAVDGNEIDRNLRIEKTDPKTGDVVTIEKDGTRVPVYEHIGWTVELPDPAGPRWLVFRHPPVDGTVTMSRIVPSPDGIKAWCFRVPFLTQAAFLETQNDRPDALREIETSGIEAIASRESDPDREKRDTDEMFNWAVRAFGRLTDRWANILVADDEDNPIELAREDPGAIEGLLGADGDMMEKLQGLNLVFWLMKRIPDIMAVQGKTGAALRKN